MSGEIKVAKNFLSANYFRQIVKILDDPDFGWFFQPNTVTAIDPEGSTAFYGFRHLFVINDNVNSSFGQYLVPLAWQAADVVNSDVQSVLNIYANMVNKKHERISEKDWYERATHTDGQLELEREGSYRYTGILYIDDADGDTVLFDDGRPGEKEILHKQTPSANTLLMFPSRIEHCPGLPYDSFVRRVININILVTR